MQLQLRVSESLNMMGRIVLEKNVSPGVGNIQTPISFKSGIYIVNVLTNGSIMTNKRLMVFSH